MALENDLQLLLPTTGIIPNKLHESLKLLNLRPDLYILKQEAVSLNLLKPTGHVMHQQFNIQQLYALPTLYL